MKTFLRHSETLEEMVLYKHDGEFWVRPKELFFEIIECDGKVMKRFEKVKYLEKTT